MADDLVRKYYDDYWGNGVSDWTPRGVTISQFEEGLLTRVIAAGSSVLDFGCGDGCHAARFLLSRDCKYVGADVSAEAVMMCKAQGLDSRQYAPDEPLPFADNTFDHVVTFEVFEHLLDPETKFRELLRVLRPGGTVIGSVPNAVYVANRMLMLFGYFDPGGSPATSLKAPWKDPHIRFFSRRTLLMCLRTAGFGNCSVTGNPFSMRNCPVLYRSGSTVVRVLDIISAPLGFLGRAWVSLFGHKLYFSATKPS